MAGVAHENHNAPLCCGAPALAVHLCDQWAGRIQNSQATRLRLFLHAPRDAVRTEDGDRSGGYFREMFDETCTLCPERVDDMSIVHDLVTHINRRAELG